MSSLSIQRHLSNETQSFLRRDKRYKGKLTQTGVYTITRIPAWKLSVDGYTYHERAWFAVQIHDYRVTETVMMYIPDGDDDYKLSRLFGKDVQDEGKRHEFVLYPTFRMASHALQGKKGMVKVWFVRVIGATATLTVKDGGVRADVPWCVLPIALATVTIHHHEAFSAMLDEDRGGLHGIEVR